MLEKRAGYSETFIFWSSINHQLSAVSFQLSVKHRDVVSEISRLMAES
jgi:hypothetical protein